MLTSIWGPPLWHVLHTISFNYPVEPTTKQKKDYRDFVLSLVNILPCKYCRDNLVNNFKLLPLTMDDMKNRDSFSRYIYELHETVNKMLSKKSNLTYEDVRDRYEGFRARCGLKKVKKCSIKKSKTKSRSKIKHKGCTDPYYGNKAKCVLNIVPIEKKCETFKISNKCKIKKKSK